MLDIEPRKATIIRGKNLSVKVAAVTWTSGLSLKAIARPKYSPIRAGVIKPADNPYNKEVSIFVFPVSDKTVLQVSSHFKNCK